MLTSGLNRTDFFVLPLLHFSPARCGSGCCCCFLRSCSHNHTHWICPVKWETCRWTHGWRACRYISSEHHSSRHSTVHSWTRPPDRSPPRGHHPSYQADPRSRIWNRREIIQCTCWTHPRVCSCFYPCTTLMWSVWSVSDTAVVTPLLTTGIQ